MGQVLAREISNYPEMAIVAGFDRSPLKCPNPFKVCSHLDEYTGKADVIIDFSHPTNLDEITGFALTNKVALVLATTGYSPDQMQKIKEVSKEVAIFCSANMSLGINLIAEALRKMSPVLIKDFDIEIIEKHHNQKSDAPSGTAKLLANVITDSVNMPMEKIYGRSGLDARRKKYEIGIHAIRGGTIPGEHTVLFAGNDEIIEIRHTAISKSIFATGAIKAAIFIHNRLSGFYSMNDLLNGRQEEQQ
jgi:4-hydroxy-tetrahydrodipicolinate reductase